MRRRRPALTDVIVKLNEGVSGEGNAMVDLRDLPRSATERAHRDRGTAPADDVRTSGALALDVYIDKLAERGGIVEERHLRRRDTQPERAAAGHAARATWSCCRPTTRCSAGPADRATSAAGSPQTSRYAQAIVAEAEIIGARLAREGVIGRFAIDFVSVRDHAGTWTSYAIEINLRKGGTTHPFLTLQFLTDGRYDGPSGLFLTAGGAEKHLVATDHLESDSLRALTIDDLFDIVARHRLHFDQARQVGVVFHMISCVTEDGRLGLTAVGNTAAEAESMYQHAERTLLDEARSALT